MTHARPLEARRSVRRRLSPECRQAPAVTPWMALLAGPFWLMYKKYYGWGTFWGMGLVLAEFYLSPNPFHLRLPVDLALLCGAFAILLERNRAQTRTAKGHGGSSPDPLAPLVLGLGMVGLTLLLPANLGAHLYRTHAWGADVGLFSHSLADPGSRRADFRHLRRDYQQAYVSGDFERSLLVNASTLCLAERVLGEADAMTLEMQSDLFQVYLQTGRYQEAQALAESLVRKYEVMFWKNHPFVAFMLNHLVSVYIAQGRYREAKTECYNCLMILEKYKGATDSHPYIQSHYAAIYSNYGYVQQQYGEFREAEKHHREALQLATAARGFRIETGLYLERLGTSLLEQMKLEDAARLFRQQRELVQRRLGSEAPWMFSVLLKEGDWSFISEHYPEARRCYEQALAVNRKHYGQKHIGAADAAYGLGRTCFAEGRLDEAETWLRMSLEIGEAALGRRNARYADYLVQTAALDMARRDYSQARTRLEEALAVLTEVYGPDHGRLLAPLEMLEETLEKSGEAGARRAIRDRWRSVRERVL